MSAALYISGATLLGAAIARIGAVEPFWALAIVAGVALIVVGAIEDAA